MMEQVASKEAMIKEIEGKMRRQEIEMERQRLEQIRETKAMYAEQYETLQNQMFESQRKQ